MLLPLYVCLVVHFSSASELLGLHWLSVPASWEGKGGLNVKDNEVEEAEETRRGNFM